jgi:dienelactone hydrolase
MVAAMSSHRFALLLAASLALAACASGPPPPKPWAETATHELHLSLASFELQGRRVTLTRSAGTSGPLPVVVYLPGIGQGGETGQRWATAWAQAGYAVLGLQPLEADQEAWRSQLARTGEFRALGELHYGEAMRAERLAALRRLVSALQASPTVAGTQLDWQHAAVAGYEIGAQTALDLGSEGWRPQAVIAISPPPMDAPGAQPPTLLITSDTDGDALGLVTRPAERRRAFDTLRPGAGWLLSLPGASHAALAGTLAPEGWHAQDQHRGGGGEGMGGGRRGGMGGGNGQGGQGSHGPAGGAPRGPRSGSATEAAQADLQDAMRLSAAFLDAQLRGAAMPASASLTVR